MGAVDFARVWQVCQLFMFGGLLIASAVVFTFKKDKVHEV
jgi:hypothetical protein